MRKLNSLILLFVMANKHQVINFSIKEKVAIAKQLEKWGIASIEAGFQQLVLIHLKRFVKFQQQ